MLYFSQCVGGFLVQLQNRAFVGRDKIKYKDIFKGNVVSDFSAIKEVINYAMPIHEKNVERIDELFTIYFNDKNFSKNKKSRSDIDNKVPFADSFAATRTINGYCFGEPLKLVSNNRNVVDEAQKLSEMLTCAQNHKATVDCTTNTSICGLGYKLVLPLDDEDCPFFIRGDIKPQQAFVVYSNDMYEKPILGCHFYRIKSKDNTSEDKIFLNVWTNYHQYFIIKKGEDYTIEKQKCNNKDCDGYPLTIKEIPLQEYERNTFRIGDWEIHQPLIEAKNKLTSNRVDDVEQIVDYILILINCKFKDKEDREAVLTDRLLELEQKDKDFKPNVDILKNPLNQSEIQVFQEYLDLKWQEGVGIPCRQERGGGGGDTGKAVIYRNGFTDLENNAGFIIPSIEKAEQNIIKKAVKYCKNIKSCVIKEIRPIDIQLVFTRSKTDDPLTASQSLRNMIESGMPVLDSLIASKVVIDPNETAKAWKEQNDMIEKKALELAEKFKKDIAKQKQEIDKEEE